MIRVDIRRRKINPWLIVATFIVPSVGVIYFAFFHKAFANNISFKIVGGVLPLITLYKAYQLITTPYDSRPMITLTDEVLKLREENEIYEKKWVDISLVSVEKDSRGTWEMEVITKDPERKKYRVWGLERTPYEIVEIINTIHSGKAILDI